MIRDTVVHDDKTGSAAPPKGASSPFAAQASIGQTDRHIEITKATQDSMITGTQEVFDRWCARRRQSVEALATLGLGALAAKTPQDVLQVWVFWTKGAMDRLLEDTKDQVAACTSAAQHVADGTTAIARSWASNGDTRVANGAERFGADVATQKPVHH